MPKMLFRKFHFNVSKNAIVYAFAAWNTSSSLMARGPQGINGDQFGQGDNGIQEYKDNN